MMMLFTDTDTFVIQQLGKREVSTHHVQYVPNLITICMFLQEEVWKDKLRKLTVINLIGQDSG